MRYFVVLLAMLTWWGCKTPASSGNPEGMSPKQHKKAAALATEQGKVLEAAYHNEMAWKQKPKMTAQLFAAAEGYYRAKDFRKATELFKALKNQNDADKFPLAGLYLARALKQEGQYDDASREYVYFINTYTGDDKDKLATIVQNEIRGCGMALQMNGTPEKDVIFEHLNTNINSDGAEFGLIPFGDDILYFSSTSGGMAKIFRTQNVSGTWTRAEIARGLPAKPDAHVCNGTFSPDGNRFYFNICETVIQEGQVTSRCDLYMTKRSNSTWTEAIKLRDYINMAGSTTTQPYVTHVGNKEYLYFSSNREGGWGGLDIWVASRDITTDDIDFTMPENIGSIVNTAGDEITPFYDEVTKALYYSSNGQTGIGGYDIMRSEGSLNRWQPSENIGMPYNSSNDDYSYCRRPNGNGGYLVSNRKFGAEKLTTLDTDIYVFSKKEETLMAKGRIIDVNTNVALGSVKVSLLELLADGTTRLMSTQESTDGAFSFTLLKGRKFKIEAAKPSYYISSFTVDPQTTTSTALENLTLGLEKVKDAVVIDDSDPKTKPTGSDTSVKPKPSGGATRPTNGGGATRPTNGGATGGGTATKPTTTGTATPTTTTPTTGSMAGKRLMKPANEAAEVLTDAQIVAGMYYKIQLAAVKDEKTMAAKIAVVKTEDTHFDTELIVSKNLTRILLGNFKSFGDAQASLAKAKANGFPDAYIVRYENGVRIKNGQ